MLIGIISYLPDTEIRIKRYNTHKKQVAWLQELYPDCEIWVVAQNYREEEYLDGVNYFTYSEGIGPSKARNVLLGLLYSSEENFMLLADDDSIIYPYYNMEEFMRLFAQDDNGCLDGVDWVVAVDPEVRPFKKSIFIDKSNLTHFKLSRKPMGLGTSLGFIRNIRKHYGQTIYYNEDLNPCGGGLGYEDIEFCIRWMLEKRTLYVADAWIKKSPMWNKSTIFTDKGDRADNKKPSLKLVLEQYARFGITFKDNRLISKEFNNSFNQTEPRMYIPRPTPIELPEKLIPKGVVEDKFKQRKLF